MRADITSRLADAGRAGKGAPGCWDAAQGGPKRGLTGRGRQATGGGEIGGARGLQDGCRSREATSARINAT